MPVAGSLFSGVGGLDLGLTRAGWEHAFFCESDPYRRRVLVRHWPGVPIHEDVRLVGAGDGDALDEGIGSVARRVSTGATDGGRHEPRLDLLCGGFPCQDLSIAGRRQGLAGGRSGLFFEFARVADDLVRPGGWVLIENVPGLLSSHNGRDFAVLLATLAELGFHDLAWRVLDSRHFGVPQRRRRVFIVARRACGGRASEVLFESERSGGDSQAGGEAGAGAASAPRGSAPLPLVTTGHGQRLDYDTDDFIVGSQADPDGMRTPPGLPGRLDVGAMSFHATQDPIWQQDGTPAIAAKSLYGVMGQGPETNAVPLDPKPDGPRYAACGDAVTVPVAEWIGRRLMEAA